jgi:carboxymethylenebutenolidase
MSRWQSICTAAKSLLQPDEAHEIMRGVPEDRAKRDLHAAFEFLRSQANVKKNRIASIGWCWGGGYSLDVALQEPTLAADIIKYGHLAVDAESLKKINAAILEIFGGKDRGIPVEDVKKFEQQLKQMGKKVQIVIYPGAGHGFENPNNKEGYRADGAADAWKRTVDFLKRTEVTCEAARDAYSSPGKLLGYRLINEPLLSRENLTRW